MRRKILFFDIDGTLIDRRLGVPEIPEEVLAKMRWLQEQGHKLLISSGRPKRFIEAYQNIGFDGFILSNGGYVEIDGRSVYENRMEYEHAKAVADLLDELQLEYMIETADQIYIRSEFQTLYGFFAAIGRGHVFTFDFDRDEVLHRTLKIECNCTEKEVEQIRTTVSRLFSFELGTDRHGTEHDFEIFPTTVSKATGVQKVLDYYGAEQTDTYAFGDGLNDREMFQFCQVSVAMGNGEEALKELATLICPPIQERGLVRALDALFPDH